MAAVEDRYGGSQGVAGGVEVEDVKHTRLCTCVHNKQVTMPGTSRSRVYETRM